MPVPFPPTAITYAGYVQCLRTAEDRAVPVFDGHLTDEFNVKDKGFVARYVVLS